MAHLNFTVLGPGSDPMALLDAIGKNNAANEAKAAGRYEEAIALHKQALEAKIEAHGVESIHSALSFNALGESYLAAGKLDEAEKCLEKALKVRDDVAFGGLGVGPRNDAAASRDNMARVLEARGDFGGAREIRLKGADKGHTMCGKSKLRDPGGAVCQKKDWITRHKPLCKKYMASRAPANSTG
ncbi:hypothetical protein VPNG_07603 [Cytospora leucostoma]|uniref:Uncharacterized protein n=1 Tax=Cytospora leucostoma TaxID=1230097 RepID=A0A423WDE7_9PEZI|nr:hypothetical protein VPNG_07603 [Cytospora leucostoma]